MMINGGNALIGSGTGRDSSANGSGFADHSLTKPIVADDLPTPEEFSRYWYTPELFNEGRYTYFARGERTGLIKIGISRAPHCRVTDLAREVCEPVKLLATLQGDVERSYHDHFALHRVGGEWFNPAAEILAEIDAILAWNGGEVRVRPIMASWARSTDPDWPDDDV